MSIKKELLDELTDKQLKELAESKGGIKRQEHDSLPPAPPLQTKALPTAETTGHLSLFARRPRLLRPVF